jgi:hypothetical protein
LEFENWNYPSQVVLVSRQKDGSANHYTVDTDNRGYFALPNVPLGQYALKAVIVPLVGERPVKIVNDLTGYNSQYYRMRNPQLDIKYDADWFPPEQAGRITTLDITWFGLREDVVSDMSTSSVGKIMMEKSNEALKNKRFWLDGYNYRRETPLDFFKNKFPESAWWKE